MGSPSESNLKAIDASVGGLVWVRRRNGSWWPGRIMGVDELSESCLVSPRSGTPVKLLGREDASVDWYNLEKSKRVKAFRCGEYDKCIEKAKASLANSTKKAVKYARREDAILHALELESAHLNKDSPDFCSGMDKSDGEQNGLGESPTLSHPCEETEQLIAGSSSSEDNSNSAQELSQSGVSFEEPNQISASKEHSVQGRRRKTPNDSEDEGIEGTKRMRGLEDLGMSAVSSLKRKRSHVASIHEFLKRKYRRRPLTKVLESTAMVSVPVLCEQLASPTGSPFPGVSDSKVSGLESNELKRCFSVVINNKSDSNGVSCENGTSLEGSEHGIDITCIKQKENENSSISGLHEDYSDRLFDVPFVWEERHSAGFSPVFESCSSQKLHVGARGNQSSQVETVSLGNEEFKESGSTSSGAAADNISISPRIEQSSSKWRLKGKRNSRLKTKNRKRNSRKHVDGEFNGCFTETQVNDFQYGSRHISDKQLYSPIPQRSRPFRQSRFRLNPKYQMQDFSLQNYGANSFLYDVNLEVKASYRPQHVPYVSLMSKLNGQAITGHPLTIEVLDDGFCDLMGSPDFHMSSSSCGHDDDLEENKSEGVDMDYEMKPNHGGGRLFTKSQPKRKNGLLTKKIRKLSSLTASHKRSKEEKKSVVEKPRGPAVACVPLKVVFSRINAALYTSMRPAHCIVALSNS